MNQAQFIEFGGEGGLLGLVGNHHFWEGNIPLLQDGFIHPGYGYH